MFHLVLATCLAADPAICAQRLLPAADAATQSECERKAEPIARDWLARHPELRGGAASCVDTATLPALTVQEIGHQTYMHQGAMAQISVQNRGQIANLSFVIGETVAVIDAGGSRAEGEALYAAIRRLTDRPISHLILTHMHPDHIMGAEVFSEAGASIIASENLPEAVARRTQAWMFSVPDQIGAEAFLGTKIAPIDQPVSAPRTIALGHADLTVTPVISAHTGTDLTVFDHGSGTLFTGDLVFRGLTPSLDGSLLGWIDWIAVGPPPPAPTLIVPGHGPAARSWDEATAPQRGYLEALRDNTAKVINAGLGLSQAIPAIVSMMQTHSEGWADFRATTARNAATAYSQLEWE